MDLLAFIPDCLAAVTFRGMCKVWDGARYVTKATRVVAGVREDGYQDLGSESHRL